METVKVTHVNITPDEDAICCLLSDDCELVYYQSEAGEVVKVRRRNGRTITKEYLQNPWVELLEHFRQHPLNWKVKALERWKEFRKSVPRKAFD